MYARSVLDPASDDSNAPFQSILLPVREVDALVDGFRIEGDWSRELGIPAHITLAGPWPLSHELPRERLSALAAVARGTRYRLDFIDMLGDARLLVPQRRPTSTRVAKSPAGRGRRAGRRERRVAPSSDDLPRRLGRSSKGCSCGRRSCLATWLRGARVVHRAAGRARPGHRGEPLRIA